MSGSRLLLSVLLICLALVLVYFVATDFNELKARNELKDRIGTATQTLSSIAQPAADLDSRLQQAQADNQNARRYLAGGDIDSTRTLDALLRTADERNLKANPLSTGQWANNTVAGSVYSKLPVEMVVSGSQADLVLFLSDLENIQLFPSLVLEAMTVTSPVLTGPSGEDDVTVLLNLSLVKRLKAVS